MKRSWSKRSNLFLLELILAIFFFSLAGAVCLRLFVQARSLSLESQRKNQALVCAKNLSGIFESREGSLPDMAEDFPQSGAEDSELEIYYDDDWELCSRKEAVYVASLRISDPSYAGHFLEGELRVSQGSQVLCALDVSCYIPLEAGE